MCGGSTQGLLFIMLEEAYKDGAIHFVLDLFNTESIEEKKYGLKL